MFEGQIKIWPGVGGYYYIEYFDVTDAIYTYTSDLCVSYM